MKAKYGWAGGLLATGLPAIVSGAMTYSWLLPTRAMPTAGWIRNVSMITLNTPILWYCGICVSKRAFLYGNLPY